MSLRAVAPQTTRLEIEEIVRDFAHIGYSNALNEMVHLISQLTQEHVSIDGIDRRHVDGIILQVRYGVGWR